MYGIAKEIGGRIFGYWVTLLGLAVPFIGISTRITSTTSGTPSSRSRRRFGLTGMADFPSMVAMLVSVYFTLRVIRRFDRVDALAAGLAAGTAIAIKPSNSVFLAGVILGLAYRRRLGGLALVGAGLAPAVLTLALWKYRGFGYVPLFRSEGAVQIAAGSHLHGIVGRATRSTSTCTSTGIT